MATSTSKDGDHKADRRDLEEDFRQLREDVAKLMEHARQAGGDSARLARHAVADRVEQVRDQVRDQGKSTFKRLRSGALDVEHEIAEKLHERPMTWLAVAAGIGYVLALLSRR